LGHFGRLSADMGESCLGRLIWSILGAWLQIWEKVASGVSFGAFGMPGRRYGRKWPQQAHLERFGRLASFIPNSARQDKQYETYVI